MANWQKELMILANDFCLNMEKAKDIVLEADNILVPQGKDEQLYKYNYAHVRIKQLIMNS